MCQLTLRAVKTSDTKNVGGTALRSPAVGADVDGAGLWWSEASAVARARARAVRGSRARRSGGEGGEGDGEELELHAGGYKWVERMFSWVMKQ